MPYKKPRNVPINMPIPNPRFGVQPVVYYPTNPWNSSTSYVRQRPRLQYRTSDVSDFSRQTQTAYSTTSPSPRSPEFANHLRYQPSPEPQRILRSTSVNKLHLIEELVDRQDLIRKQMRETIAGWKVVVKDIPKVGKKMTVDDQMKRIRALCGDINQHLQRWKVNFS
jgi:hypothetical protein